MAEQRSTSGRTLDGGLVVAVVGATGAVGEAILDILSERRFPVARLHALASQRSLGQVVRFGERAVSVEDIAAFEFAGVDLALFSAGASVSEEHAPRAAASGCTVVDNTSQFRYDEAIPLVVPEVNPHWLVGLPPGAIIANPNCSTIQMVVALKPIHDAATLTRVNVATYQAVSGSGREAMEELAGQTAALLNGRPAEPRVYPRQIAFNALPHIDRFMDNGYTREEMKMVWESRKILELPELAVNATAVRIPVFHGHSEAIHLETERPLSADQARELLSSAPGVHVVDGLADGAYPTPVTEAANHDAVFVGRIRGDISHPRGLNLWVVADNLRKGAALNSIQIAERLLANGHWACD